MSNEMSVSHAHCPHRGGRDGIPATIHRPRTQVYDRGSRAYSIMSAGFTAKMVDGLIRIPSRIVRLCIGCVAIILSLGTVMGADTLSYHEIRTDPGGKMAPWYDPDPTKSYDHCLSLVWNYWRQMPKDYRNGQPFLNAGPASPLRTLHPAKPSSPTSD